MGNLPNPFGKLDELSKEEQDKIYFIDWRGEPVLLTPAQMTILRVIAEDYEEELEKIKDLPFAVFAFILKLAETEQNCAKKAAKKLSISPNTVSTQLTRVKYKLHIKSNLQLLMLYSMTVKDFFQRREK
jgi:DNA-binding MarR family transcriptional regulator